MDHPVIERVIETGYAAPPVVMAEEEVMNACDACNEYEASVKFFNIKLCSTCCKEEGIQLL